MIRRTLRILTVAIVADLWAPDAWACSCMSSGPPCQATWTADVVFSGIVTAVHVEDPSLLGPKRVQFTVERAFRNATTGPLHVLTSGSGAACGYDFKVGKRYLVYARNVPTVGLSTGICSRTRPLEEADDDLQYLSAIPPTGTGARIFGRVKQREWDPGKEVEVDYGPVEGFTVEVRGAGFSRQARTNEDGRYEILGVPTGKITIEGLAPPELNPSSMKLESEVRDPRACMRADFSVHWEGQIGGSVVDSTGRPVVGLELQAVPAERATDVRSSYSINKATTDASGTFLITGLSPASYVVGVNLREPPTLDAPYPPTYAPGTSVLGEAVIVEVAAGEEKRLKPIRLPAPLPEQRVEGCVAFPDGRPASGASVLLRHAASSRQVGFPIQVDGNGCFSLRALHGVAYSLRASTTDPNDQASYLSVEAAIAATSKGAAVRLVLGPRR